MATNEKIEKSYTNLGKQGDLFTIRTMKGDIERLRQGLPLTETPYTSPTPPQFDPSRRLASDISEHNSSELPPQEARQALGVSIPAMQPPAYTPPAGGSTQRPTLPSYATTPYVGSTVLPAREPKPIETLQPKAQPSIPTQPRGGVIEAVTPAEELAGERETSGKIITFLRQGFSSQKRITAGVSAALCLLVVGAYALFAVFGKPLPGWQFVFPSLQPSPQPTTTA